MITTMTTSEEELVRVLINSDLMDDVFRIRLSRRFFPCPPSLVSSTMFLSCHFLVIAGVVLCRRRSSPLASIFFLLLFPLSSSLSLTIGRFHVRATNATSCSASPANGFSYFFSSSLPFLRLKRQTDTHTHTHISS